MASDREAPLLIGQPDGDALIIDPLGHADALGVVITPQRIVLDLGHPVTFVDAESPESGRA